MAFSEITIEDIGAVKIFRRKGLKYMRITVNHDGTLRLSLPWFVPKNIAIKYLISKKSWIKKHQKPKVPAWTDGRRLTKNYVLKLELTSRKTTYSEKSSGTYKIHVPEHLNDSLKEQLIKDQVLKFLRSEAEKILPEKLNVLAKKHGYKVKAVKIKKLKSRWGSCSHEKAISLNILLIHIPEKLSNYVLIHELAHTRHLNHSKAFWEEVESKIRDYKERRKELRKFNPAGIF